MSKSFWILLYATVYICVWGADGSITGKMNPGCNTTDPALHCEKPYLFTVENTPDDDSGHTYFHMWSGVGNPSFASLSMGKGSNISVDWDKNGLHNINTSEPALDVFGVAFTQLVMYNDAEDVGDLAHTAVRAHIALTRFQWAASNVTSGDAVSVTFTSTHVDGDMMPKGSAINITLSNAAAVSRAEAPSLLQSPSSFLVSVDLDSLLAVNLSRYAGAEKILGADYAKTLRFGVRMAFASGEERTQKSEELQLEKIRSLDDEHCPGVFKLDTIRTPRGAFAASDAPAGGFMQYRDVVYLKGDNKQVTYSTFVTVSEPGLLINSTRDVTPEEYFSPVTTTEPTNLEHSLLYVLFGDDLTSRFIAEETVMSFGRTADLYYFKYNFTSFAFTLGVGAAPTEGLSDWMLSVVIIDLALPVAALILGLVGYLMIRARQDRRRRAKDGLLSDE